MVAQRDYDEQFKLAFYRFEVTSYRECASTFKCFTQRLGELIYIGFYTEMMITAFDLLYKEVTINYLKWLVHGECERLYETGLH